MSSLFSVRSTLVTGVLVLVLAGCDPADRRRDNRPVEDEKPSDTITFDSVKNQVRDALQSAKDYTYEHKDEYVQKMQGVVDELNRKLVDLKARAESASAEARTRLQPQIDELRRQADALQTQLEKVKAASPEIWNDVKTGVRDAFEDLQKAFEKARERVK